jgi:hypothetical protein
MRQRLASRPVGVGTAQQGSTRYGGPRPVAYKPAAQPGDAADGVAVSAAPDRSYPFDRNDAVLRDHDFLAAVGRVPRPGHRRAGASLVVVSVTGIALIVGNPRSLRDPALQVKLWLMVPAIATTLVLAVALRGEALWQKKPGACGMMSFAAAAALVLWLGVTFAGRGRWMLNLIG